MGCVNRLYVSIRQLTNMEGLLCFNLTHRFIHCAPQPGDDRRATEAQTVSDSLLCLAVNFLDGFCARFVLVVRPLARALEFP